MIRSYHWLMSGAFHIGIAAFLFVASEKNGTYEIGNVSGVDSGTESIHLTMAPNAPSATQPESDESQPASDPTQPVKQSQSEEQPQSGRQQYAAIAGDVRGDHDGASESTVHSVADERRESQPAEKPTTEPSTILQPTPTDALVQTPDDVFVESSQSDPVLSNPSAAFGTAAFTRREGQTVPGFVITNLSSQFLQSLVDDGALLLVAMMGNRNIRFSGSPTEPIAASVDDRLGGYSERGLQAPEQVRGAAWRVLAREFGYRDSQRDGVQIDFMLSQELDQLINTAQRDAAHRVQKPVHELRLTHGLLLRIGGAYRFVIDRVE